MSIVAANAVPNPEEALAAVEPDRRDFALLYAEGKTPIKELYKLAGSTATYYRWIKDERILAYADAAARDISRRGRRRLRHEVDDAIENLVSAQTDPDVTPTMLKASLEILDRAGVTKEEITKVGQGGGDPLVVVNLSIPINASAKDEQDERQRRQRARELAQEATYVDVTAE